MSRDERIEYIKEKTNALEKDLEIIKEPSLYFGFDQADKMVENAIGIIPLPLGIATNFIVNGKEYLIPMAIEEPSVIAAASYGAKIAKIKGGFTALMEESIMIGQIQLVKYDSKSIDNILENKGKILELANSMSNKVKAIDLKIKEIEDESTNNFGNMLIVEILIDTKEAMGANIINTMCETISPILEDLSKGIAILKILSNFATRKTVKCKAIFSKDEIGQSVIERILYAYAFAYSDPYRAVTHNKGIMNGIDSVAIATGQDFRAIEAGAHAYASRDGTYRTLSHWYRNGEGDLVGEMDIPMPIGIVGGVINVNPIYNTALKIMGISSLKELAHVMCSVGLAQNFSAIRALASEGIQRGHMKLHARNIAVSVGARNNEVDIIATKIFKEKKINSTRAKELLDEIRTSYNT